MTKKLSKNIFLLLTLLFLIIIFTFCDNSLVAEGAILDSKNDYILTYVKNTKEGKTILGLELGIDFHGLNKDQLEFDVYKDRLIKTLDEFKNKEKESILFKNTLNDEESIKIDENVKFSESFFDYQNNCAGFEIEFGSFETYKLFYEDVSKEFKENFLVSKLNISFSSPYLSIVENEQTKKDYYISEIKRCSQGLSFEKKFINWQPDLFFDFITFNERAFSSAIIKGMDGSYNYHHIWEVSQLSGNKTMEVKLNIINKGWWYLLGIAIPLVCMGTAILFIKLTKKK